MSHVQMSKNVPVLDLQFAIELVQHGVATSGLPVRVRPDLKSFRWYGSWQRDSESAARVLDEPWYKAAWSRHKLERKDAIGEKEFGWCDFVVEMESDLDGHAYQIGVIVQDGHMHFLLDEWGRGQDVLKIVGKGCKKLIDAVEGASLFGAQRHSIDKVKSVTQIADFKFVAQIDSHPGEPVELVFDLPDKVLQRLQGGTNNPESADAFGGEGGMT